MSKVKHLQPKSKQNRQRQLRLCRFRANERRTNPMYYYENFPNFYKHPFIQSIANRKRWTVSDNDKAPLDVVDYKNTGRAHGALYKDSQSLVSLDELITIIPDAANHAFYLDAMIDCFVVLDIEPKCPDDIKTELLKLPYIYGEISLSGKGYHLIFPLPDCINEYPDAQKKVVLEGDNKYYEILMNHYCTFTRNMLPPSDPNADPEAFDNLFESLASRQKSVNEKQFDITKEKPDIPAEEKILSVLAKQKYDKTLNDFAHDDGSYDNSRYEYNYILFLYRKLNIILCVTPIQKASNNHDYTDNEKAWLLYEIAKDYIKYRPKHDETRNGMPWLLFMAQKVIAKNQPKE